MVASVTGDVGWLVVAWGLGAIVSLAGALCYAELATAYPHAGGDYYFLTRTFGRATSFLYAWARSTVINSGSIALLAFVFGDYMSTVFSLGPASGALWAAGIVVALTLLNITGLRTSAGTQNLLTVIEVGGLLAVAVAGFLAPPVAAVAPAAFTTTPALGMFGAMVFVL
jgi:amino acid transporter